MKLIAFILSALLWLTSVIAADISINEIRLELDGLKKRVAALEEENLKLKHEAKVERLIVTKELIVSDTDAPWEKGFEAHQIPRGIYARSVGMAQADFGFAAG